MKHSTIPVTPHKRGHLRSGRCGQPLAPTAWALTALLGRRLPVLVGLALALALALSKVHAEIPEPDNVFYGVITLGATPVTAANTNVLVEARKIAAGPVVSRYRMGDNPAYGDGYSLEVPLEAFSPLTDTNASRLGAVIHLSVRDHSGVRDTRTISIAQRGQVVRLDFTELDTDGDGVPDRWEQQFFGNTTGADPNADPDGDGRDNRQEYLAGTNPLAPDGRHPADSAPTDNVLSTTEADHYANAWLHGDLWPLAPTNIPIAYVTRAALLAANGGSYVFTNSPPTNAPQWWVNVPRSLDPIWPRSNAVAATMAVTATVQSPATIIIATRPDPSNSAYAVEDQVPAGWEVLSISHGGAFDAANHQVKWGPFPDASDRVLTYDVVPSGPAGIFSFVGTGSFDGFNVTITGNRVITIGLPLRWAATSVDGQGLRFVLTGQASRSYLIELSTNLAQWQTLETISTDAAGQYTFRPANAGGSPPNFYRARTP